MAMDNVVRAIFGIQPFQIAVVLPRVPVADARQDSASRCQKFRRIRVWIRRVDQYVHLEFRMVDPLDHVEEPGFRASPIETTDGGQYLSWHSSQREGSREFTSKQWT